MENKMRKFIDHIQSTVPDSPIEKSDLEEFCISKSLKKGEVLLSIGSVCRHYYYVNRGVLRVYYFNDAA